MNKLSTIFAAILLSSAPIGCRSYPEVVRPHVVTPQAPSFDGNHQDSGLLEITPMGALVTLHFQSRYNALIDVYGDEPDFAPHLIHDQGVTRASESDMKRYPDRGPLFVLQKEALVNFIKMNQWRKMGKTPTNKKSPGVMARVFKAVVSTN